MSKLNIFAGLLCVSAGAVYVYQMVSTVMVTHAKAEGVAVVYTISTFVDTSSIEKMAWLNYVVTLPLWMLLGGLGILLFIISGFRKS